jgi:hypothetical protein
VDLLDLVTHHQLEDEGLVEVPMFIPPPFDDIAALRSASVVYIDRVAKPRWADRPPRPTMALD